MPSLLSGISGAYARSGNCGKGAVLQSRYALALGEAGDTNRVASTIGCRLIAIEIYSSPQAKPALALSLSFPFRYQPLSQCGRHALELTKDLFIYKVQNFYLPSHPPQVTHRQCAKPPRTRCKYRDRRRKHAVFWVKQLLQPPNLANNSIHVAGGAGRAESGQSASHLCLSRPAFRAKRQSGQPHQNDECRIQPLQGRKVVTPIPNRGAGKSDLGCPAKVNLAEIIRSTHMKLTRANTRIALRALS